MEITRFLFLLVLPLALVGGGAMGLVSCGVDRQGIAAVHYAGSALEQSELADLKCPPLIASAHWAEGGPEPSVVAGTVSHHMLAAWYIDRWFKELAELRTVSSFIVISPRHYQQGLRNIALSPRDWLTGLGRVETDFALADRLRAGMGTSWDPDSFFGEHGIGTIASYIKKYFPTSRIVAIAMDIPNFKMSECLELGGLISAEIKKDPGLFLIISSDFSHHKGLKETEEVDARSEKALAFIDGNSARSVGCDNNAGMVVLAKTLGDLGRGRGFIAAHSSAYEIVGINEDITSYFFTYY